MCSIEGLVDVGCVEAALKVTEALQNSITNLPIVLQLPLDEQRTILSDLILMSNELDAH